MYVYVAKTHSWFKIFCLETAKTQLTTEQYFINLISAMFQKSERIEPAK